MRSYRGLPVRVTLFDEEIRTMKAAMATNGEREKYPAKLKEFKEILKDESRCGQCAKKRFQQIPKHWL